MARGLIPARRPPAQLFGLKGAEAAQTVARPARQSHAAGGPDAVVEQRLVAPVAHPLAVAQGRPADDRGQALLREQRAGPALLLGGRDQAEVGDGLVVVHGVVADHQAEVHGHQLAVSRRVPCQMS